MKPQKLFFILSIFGILLLLFVGQVNSKPTIEGKIGKINYWNNRVSLYLENSSIEIIIFTEEVIGLQYGQRISVYGRQELYKNKLQIIADKIIVNKSK